MKLETEIKQLLKSGISEARNTAYLNTIKHL